MAMGLAKQMDVQFPDNEEFINVLFVQVLTREPTPEERQACRHFLIEQEQLLENPEQLTSFDTGKENTTLPVDPRLHARANLVHVLMNHNDFITVR